MARRLSAGASATPSRRALLRLYVPGALCSREASAMSNSRAALPAHDLLRGVDLPVGAGRRKFAVALSGGYCGARGAVGPDEREEEVMLPASTASELLSLAEQGDMTLGEVLKEALSALRAVREGGSGSAVGGDPNGAALPDGGDEYQNSEGPYCHHDSTRKRLPPFPPSWGSSITTPVGCLEPVLPLVFGLLDPNNDVPSARLVCRGWAKIGFAAVESLQLNHRETFVLQKPLLLRTGDGEADPPAGGVMWEGGRSVHHALPSDWAERLPGLRHLELSDDSDSGTWRNASEKLILGLRSLTQLTRLTISSIRQVLIPPIAPSLLLLDALLLQ